MTFLYTYWALTEGFLAELCCFTVTGARHLLAMSYAYVNQYKAKPLLQTLDVHPVKKQNYSVVEWMQVMMMMMISNPLTCSSTT